MSVARDLSMSCSCRETCSIFRAFLSQQKAALCCESSCEENVACIFAVLHIYQVKDRPVVSVCPSVKLSAQSGRSGLCRLASRSHFLYSFEGKP